MYTGTIVDYTVAVSGDYALRTVGADGGSILAAATYFGGGGAEAAGDINLNAGTVLAVVVGGVGGALVNGVGGGGGTFIYEVSSAIPEAPAWALMLMGFAGLGLVGRRATRKGAAVSAPG